jgi:hypothetical protein
MRAGGFLKGGLSVRQITITLPDELYVELQTVSSECTKEMGFGPETWAQEAVESALASRRLPVSTHVTIEDIYERRPIMAGRDSDE